MVHAYIFIFLVCTVHIVFSFMLNALDVLKIIQTLPRVTKNLRYFKHYGAKPFSSNISNRLMRKYYFKKQQYSSQSPIVIETI